LQYAAFCLLTSCYFLLPIAWFSFPAFCSPFLPTQIRSYFPECTEIRAVFLSIYTVKKSCAKFRCGHRWREPNDEGVGNFLLPRVLWFCATVVNIGIWRILTWLFLQCTDICTIYPAYQIAEQCS
jgi:hypothetical protein